MILWEYIRRKLLEYPMQCICENNVYMTYEELCVFAEHRAKQMDAPYYGILCKSEMAAAISLLCCIAAGKTAVPLPVRYGQEHYLKILECAEPPVILSDYDGALTEIRYTTESFVNDLCEDTAVVLFTSGSTGTPKGVMLSEDNIIANVRGISAYLPIDQRDTILISRPLYHSSVMTGEFLVALCNGAKIVFSSEPFRPLSILKLLKECEVTVFGHTPTMVASLSRLKKNDDLAVRIVLVSGECINEGVARNIRKGFPEADIYCGYGLSEASPRVAYLPADLFDQTPTAAGFPLKSVNLRIVNESGKDVNVGEVGELLVQGPNVMQGYFKDAKRTQIALRENWLHTGDLAKWGRDNMLYIKGRKDDMIIRAGMNIYPAEIENILSLDPRTREVMAYGYQTKDTQEIGLAICGEYLNREEVLALCREKLPQHMVPARIQIVDDPQVLLGGKKQRRNIC